MAHVDAALEHALVNYGGVLSEGDIFEPAFLDSLDATQHDVLMPVVMHLIAQGSVPFNAFGKRLATA